MRQFKPNNAAVEAGRLSRLGGGPLGWLDG
jgi:hypothetical protein